MNKPRGIGPLTYKGVGRRGVAGGGEGGSKWLVAPSEGDACRRIGQLPHAPQRIAQVVLPAARLLLPDPTQAIQVGICAVGENLCQPRIEIEGVARGDAAVRPAVLSGVHGLAQAVAKAIVGEGVRRRTVDYGR